MDLHRDSAPTKRSSSYFVMWLIALLWAFTPLCHRPFAAAAEMQFISLRGPGTAIVTFDDERKIAFITDGGHSGERGISGSQLDGNGLLDAILERGIETIVLTCSHPHADHIGGLLDLIADDNMASPQIKAVYFVDSEYPANSTLLSAYTTRWPKGASPHRTVQHLSASDQDALAALNDPAATVHTHNFKYLPDPSDTTAHGKCVITLTILRQGGESAEVLDLDDASDNLIRKWAEWALEDPTERRPTVIVLPHHGSARSDISPLMDSRICPQSAIVTVNADNQYRHPGPRTLLALIKALGVENVHLTGGSSNILVTERGVPKENNAFQRALHFEVFLTKGMLDAQEELLSLEAGSAGDKSNATLEKAREVQKTYAELRTLMGADDSDRRRARAREYVLEAARITRRSTQDFAAFDKTMRQYDDEQAEKRLAFERMAIASLKAIRDALDARNCDEAARCAQEALALNGWTRRQLYVLQGVVVGRPVLNGQDIELDWSSKATGSREQLLSLPDILGSEGAFALRDCAYREARRMLSGEHPASPQQMRWTVDALVASGASRSTVGRELCELFRGRLLLNGFLTQSDVSGVALMRRQDAARQLSELTSSLKNRSSDTFSRDWPVAAHKLQSPASGLPVSHHDDSRIAKALGQLKREGGNADASVRRLYATGAVKAMSRTLSLLSQYKEQEVRIRSRLVEQAAGSIGEGVRVSEGFALYRSLSEGHAVHKMFSELKQDRSPRLWEKLQAEKQELSSRSREVPLEPGGALNSTSKILGITREIENGATTPAGPLRGGQKDRSPLELVPQTGGERKFLLEPYPDIPLPRPRSRPPIMRR